MTGEPTTQPIPDHAEEDLASAPDRIRPMPTLGRGIVWSDIVAKLEAEQRIRELPALPIPTTAIAMDVPVAREVLGDAEPRLEDEIIAAALTGDVTGPPPPPSTPLEDVRTYVETALAAGRAGWVARAIARIRR